MHAIIDRFEGKYAIVELPGKKMMNIDRSKIPEQAKEGDMLLIDGDSVIIEEKETLKRKAEIAKLMRNIWE